jgi:thiol:disulfide interchange protein/DsbC/DsbD-like thiol-disulfide interchange protein
MALLLYRLRNYRFCTLTGRLLLLLLGLLPWLPVSAQVVEGEHVDAELLAETQHAVPGETLWTALRLDHLENWHTYWINPGEAGLPTRINWNLPPGVSAGEIFWPIPERFDLPGDIVDFGYTGEIFLLIPLTLEAGFAEDRLAVTAEVSWLECEVICIPSGATVPLELPVAAASPAPLNGAAVAGFAQTRNSQPRADIALDAQFSLLDGQVELLVQATENIFADAHALRFIPDVDGVVDYKAEQNITSQLSSLQLSQKWHRRIERSAPERLGGLLLVTGADGREVAYAINATPTGVNTAALAATAGTAGSRLAEMGLGMVFLFAMLGGLILNLMPCVFPVLSLKVLTLSSNSSASLREQRLHGLAYTAGVMLAFLALAAVLLSLQAGGAAIGWGFHLQTPWFVAALIYLFFVMGLSLSGVVEFGTSIMGVGSALQEKEGYSGSFFTGVLASVVASPCTAPFMGAALGFAFTQSMPVALTVFLALGFGMALPFLLLSFIPALARRMPRPGSWMLVFKQVLAFPLYATAVWLLWVLGQQTDANAMALVIGGCVLLAFAAWLYQQRHETRGWWKPVAVLLLLFCLGSSVSVLRSPFLATRTGSAELAADANYEPYSAARLAALRAEGRPVFVNMTAAWCITCLVNEKVALSSATIASALVDRGVTYLKGDWTNNDPEITAVLKQYETSGVPLYLLFPADSARPAEILPQILTESLVLEALERI